MSFLVGDRLTPDRDRRPARDEIAAVIRTAVMSRPPRSHASHRFGQVDEPHRISIFLPQAFQPILSFTQSTGVVGNEILLKLSLVRVSNPFVHVVDSHTRSLTTITAILGPSFLLLSSSAIPTHTPPMSSLATLFLALIRPKAHCSPLASF